jgi:hypothetical protein
MHGRTTSGITLTNLAGTNVLLYSTCAGMGEASALVLPQPSSYTTLNLTMLFSTSPLRGAQANMPPPLLPPPPIAATNAGDWTPANSCGPAAAREVTRTLHPQPSLSGASLHVHAVRKAVDSRRKPAATTHHTSCQHGSNTMSIG